MYSLTLIQTCRGLHPRTPPWLFLPYGQSSQVQPSRSRSCLNRLGMTDDGNRPSPVGSVSRSTRSHPS